MQIRICHVFIEDIRRRLKNPPTTVTGTWKGRGPQPYMMTMGILVMARWALWTLSNQGLPLSSTLVV